MSNNDASPGMPGTLTEEQMKSALFGSLVMQQFNMALMFLGQEPHPETGQPVQDLDAARMFIDQLEMLESKTKGNLTQDEKQLLKNTLTSLHMAFVDAVGQKMSSPSSAAEPSPSPEPKQAGEAAPTLESSSVADDDAESKKKFTKKY